MSAQRDQFIQMYMPQAQRVAAQLNVPVDGVLNHWGLETGWGKSVIPGPNNLGNIKDFSGGGTSAVDNMTKTRDKYRQYATADDFANDYARMISSNPRYAHALNTNSVYDFANGLQRGGYAEDPNFARKVAGMPIQNNIVDDVAVIDAMGGLPVTRQAYGMGNGNFKSKQIDPNVAAELEGIRQQKMEMLPYALAHAMSSNRGSQNFGQLLTALAMPGMDGTKMRNGTVLPSGQYITDQDDSAMLRAQAAMKSASGGLPGTISHFGYTPEGDRVVTSSKRGGQFTVGMDANGDEVFTPYEGAATPKGEYEDNMKVVTKSMAALDSANKTLSMIEANPDAFSSTAMLISKMPKTMSAWAAGKYLPPETMEARASILRNAAKEMSELYGAAQSLGEEARARQFIPSLDDPPEMVISKLKALRDIVETASKQYGDGMVKMARKRAGQVSNEPAVGNPSTGGQNGNDPLGLRSK